MAIKNYYTNEYSLYGQQLADVDSLITYKETLSDSVTQVSQMAEDFYNDVEEISGVSIDQLSIQAKMFFNGIEKTSKKIEQKLPRIISLCESLGNNLDDLKTYNEVLHTEYDRYLDLLNDENPDESAIEEAKDEYLETEKYCEELDPTIKDQISQLKSFNAEIEDFAIELLDYQICFDEEYSDPSLSNKEQYERMIESYLEKYERKRRNLRSNGHDGLVSVLNALGYPYDISMDGPFNYESFKKLHAFINTPIYIAGNKTPIDIINDYFTGTGWTESGMGNLAFYIGCESGIKVKSATSADYEIEFWRNMIYQIDGRGESNNPTAYFLMSTDYFKEYGGSSSFADIYDMLAIDFPTDINDPNYQYCMDHIEKFRVKYLNNALINSLKDEFVDQGYLSGLNEYVKEINQLNDEYGSDVLPFLEALDGRIDWFDNNSVIPKEAIQAYVNGASWEESELSLFCPDKTEEEFLKDLISITGKDYEIYNYTDEEWDKNLVQDQNRSFFTFKETNSGSDIYAGVDKEHPSASQVKEILKSSGAGKKIGSYYDFNNQRNDQIDAETMDLYVLSKSINRAQDLLAEVYPTEDDLARNYNKELGKKIAEEHLEYVRNVSGRDEHVTVMTQDDYVALRQAEDPSLSREEILKDYVSAWKAEYKDELIRDKNYNPECARRMAEKQNYDNKMVVKYDDLNIFESVKYSAREIAAGGITMTTGVGSGLVDLGRNLKHVVAPDLVPSPLEYAQDEIALQYNDPESKYYDPVLGGVYSISRAVGHYAPIQALKAIPQTTTIGKVLETADLYGSRVQSAYVATGGDWAKAELNALGKAVVTDAAGMANVGLTNKGLGTVVANVITGEARTYGFNAIDLATGVKTFDQVSDGAAKDQMSALVYSVNGNFFPGSSTINKFGNGLANKIIKKEVVGAINSAPNSLLSFGVRDEQYPTYDGEITVTEPRHVTACNAALNEAFNGEPAKTGNYKASN